MKSFARRSRHAAALALAWALSGCGGGGGAAIDAPTITNQPQTVSVSDGDVATFSVTTTGSAPISYTWQKNGTAIPGATGASYITPPLTLTDSNSQYRVVISNAAGTVTSQAAGVTVNPVAPTVDVQPASMSVLDGNVATFSVHAAGSHPQNFQWLENGVPIAGANGSSLSLEPASLSDSGATFTVQVSNVAGSVTSQSAVLTVTPVAAHITVAPQAQTVVDGSGASFSVSAVGSAALSYQWYADGVPVPGATNAVYSFLPSYADNGRRLSVTVSNAYGSDTSAAVLLTVDPRAPTFSAAPQDVSVQVGGAASFLVSAAGTAPMSYQWERSDDGGLSWVAIPGGTSATFSVSAATLAWADAQLRVKVSNVAGTVTSNIVALRLTPDVHILAGIIGGSGYADGRGSQVRFNGPSSSVFDAQGNLYVVDRFNSAIRKIAPDGTVSTLVGRPGQRGVIDGPASVARFNFPLAVAIDASGNLYVGDGTALRRVAPDGTVSTIAGQLGAGSADGIGSAASFSEIRAIVSDGLGNLVLVDGGANQTLRKVSSTGAVSTLAGSAGAFGSANGQGSVARFTDMWALTVNANGHYFVADNQTIREVAPDGTVSLYAGTPGVQGDADGTRQSALFSSPSGLAFDAVGNLYVSEPAFVRRIAPDGTTITLAGGAPSTGGDVDGSASAAYLHYATGLTPSPDGSQLIFCEPHNNTVRRITLAGTVTTLAGTSPQYSHVDGAGSNARFFMLSALARDAQGVVIMPEGAYQSLRRIDQGGNVSSVSLSNPSFANIRAITLDASGTAYVADSALQQIAKISGDGTVTVLAGMASTIGHQDGPGGQATFAFPGGLAVDAAGNVFVADSQNSTIRKIDTAGNVTTVAGQPGLCGNADGVGSAALLCHPMGMAFDAQGRLFIADDWAHTIRRLDPDGRLNTAGGSAFAPGLSNGFVSRFSSPMALDIDAAGNVFVADSDNAVVRRLTPSGFASTVMGRPGVLALQPGAGGAINRMNGLVVLPNGRVVISTELAIVED